MTNDKYLDDFNLIFLFNINIGTWLSDEAFSSWNDLIQGKTLFDMFKNYFSDKVVKLGSFNRCNEEIDVVRSRINEIEKEKGKRVLSNTFLANNYLPLIFEEPEGTALQSPNYPINSGNNFNYTEGKNSWQLLYKDCLLRITSDGTLSFKFSFKYSSDNNHKATTENFISLHNYLKQACESTFKIKADTFITDLRPLVSGENVELFEIDEEKISSSFDYHEIIILKGFIDINGNKCDQVKSLTEFKDGPDLSGILNQSSWFKLYSKQEIENAKNKNIGYKTDEIFLTDSHTSLIVLRNYWDSRQLELYIENLVLLIELVVAKLPFLDYLTGNVTYEGLGSSKTDEIIAVKELAGKVGESLDLDQLVLHGFTKKFLNQLCEERNINRYLKKLENKLQSVTDASQLAWQNKVANDGLKINSNALKVATVAILLTLILGLVSLYISIENRSSLENEQSRSTISTVKNKKNSKP